MASSSDVSVRICVQNIIKYDLEVKALIQDIRECRGPHSLLMELNGAVKEKSNHLRQRIQDMEQLAKEQDKETDKNVIMAEMERHRKQMLSNQTAWRKANLACKLAIDNLEKDELLHGGDTSVRQRLLSVNKHSSIHPSIHPSIDSVYFIVVRIVVDLEPLLGTRNTPWIAGHNTESSRLYCHSSHHNTDEMLGTKYRLCKN
ncbi:vesicle transport protein SEC20 isoform X1 [Hemibagrus wyckioides]|uniref:vesicle transport protein SEC20 isoform X1 n=1 Tax=Hemibagrus wyckioides TaxID=337641 RepID=UPI00266CB355|nr:vesicle transport protein SEC20 isoform X1 [Hemibagrus wyckioides]